MIHNIHTCQFSFQTYPNEGHELQGVLEHVYRSMEDFFQECLSLDTDDPRAPPDTWDSITPQQICHHLHRSFLATTAIGTTHRALLQYYLKLRTAKNIGKKTNKKKNKKNGSKNRRDNGNDTVSRFSIISSTSSVFNKPLRNRDSQRLLSLPSNDYYNCNVNSDKSDFHHRKRGASIRKNGSR